VPAKQEPGWTIQCLAGRLMLWHKRFDSWRPAMMPHTPEAVSELLEVAREIRAILAAARFGKA
jgi:hypothetical protein